MDGLKRIGKKGKKLIKAGKKYFKRSKRGFITVNLEFKPQLQ